MRTSWRCLVAALVLGCAAPAAAGEPELFLSWRAPHGAPGASSVLARPCGDTTQVDSLYLCVRLGENATGVYALKAQVLFSAGTGDTLAPTWRNVGGRGWPGFLQVEFPGDSAGASGSLWTAAGIGSYAYDFTSANARVRMICGAPPGAVRPVSADGIYTLARLLLRRSPARTPGCDQPLCMQFVSASLLLEPTKPVVNGVLGKYRFVSMNSAADRVCREYRKTRPIVTAPAASDTAQAR